MIKSRTKGVVAMKKMDELIKIEGSSKPINLENADVFTSISLQTLSKLESTRIAQNIEFIALAYNEVMGRTDGQADHTVAEDPKTGAVVVRPALRAAIEAHIAMLMDLHDAAYIEGMSRQGYLRDHFRAIIDGQAAAKKGTIS